MPTTPDRFTFILTQAGCLIGTLEETEDGFFLLKPRSVTIIPKGPGMIQFQFSELIGKPDRVVVVGGLTYWTVTDPNVVQTYLESISSIKIAHTLPPRQTVN